MDDDDVEDVAMTRNVVRSKRTTSVALQASAKVLRCFDRTEALVMRVCTMLDHDYQSRLTWIQKQEKNPYLVQTLVINTRPKYSNDCIPSSLLQFLILLF